VKLMDWHIPVILLHCVSIYPCPPHYLQLSGIQFLQNRYEQCPVGYSGHEEGILPSVIAWMMGACMIERHITTDRNMYGSDQKAAITMNEMRLLRQLTSGERIDIGEMKGRFNRKTLIGTEEAVMEKFISQMRGIFMP
jgi:N-acetylneuraminate synthase